MLLCAAKDAPLKSRHVGGTDGRHRHLTAAVVYAGPVTLPPCGAEPAMAKRHFSLRAVGHVIPWSVAALPWVSLSLYRCGFHGREHWPQSSDAPSSCQPPSRGGARRRGHRCSAPPTRPAHHLFGGASHDDQRTAARCIHLTPSSPWRAAGRTGRGGPEPDGVHTQHMGAGQRKRDGRHRGRGGPSRAPKARLGRHGSFRALFQSVCWTSPGTAVGQWQRSFHPYPPVPHAMMRLCPMEAERTNFHCLPVHRHHGAGL